MDYVCDVRRNKKKDKKKDKKKHPYKTGGRFRTANVDITQKKKK